MCKWFHYRFLNFPGSSGPIMLRCSDEFLSLPCTRSLWGYSHRNVLCRVFAAEAFSFFSLLVVDDPQHQPDYSPPPPPQTIFRQIGFLIWFPFHQIKSVTRMMRGNIANTLGQQILLPGAICQWCQMTVFLSFLSHRKICTFSFFTVQRNIDLPHYCNSYNHSCHNQTYCKIIRLIRITLQ